MAKTNKPAQVGDSPIIPQPGSEQGQATDPVSTPAAEQDKTGEDETTNDTTPAAEQDKTETQDKDPVVKDPIDTIDPLKDDAEAEEAPELNIETTGFKIQILSAASYGGGAYIATFDTILKKVFLDQARVKILDAKPIYVQAIYAKLKETSAVDRLILQPARKTASLELFRSANGL